MTSETSKAWETPKPQCLSAEQEFSTGSGPRKRACASFSPVWQKALLSLGKADDCKTLFFPPQSYHKIIFREVFSRKDAIAFTSFPCWAIQDMQASFSLLLRKKESAQMKCDNSLIAPGSPSGSSSVTLANTAPGSTKVVAYSGGGRRNRDFWQTNATADKQKRKTTHNNKKLMKYSGLGLVLSSKPGEDITTIHEWRQRSNRFLQYAITPYLLETCFSSPSEFCLIKFPISVLF